MLAHIVQVLFIEMAILGEASNSVICSMVDDLLIENFLHMELQADWFTALCCVVMPETDAVVSGMQL